MIDREQIIVTALKLALEGAANYIDTLGGDSRKYRQALTQPRSDDEQPAIKQDLTPEQAAQKRPQNCGTSYCSCIECVMEPEHPAIKQDLTTEQPAQQQGPKKDLMYSTVAMQERHAAFVDRAVATLEQAKREALAEQPAHQQEPVAFLANGTRFKMSFFENEADGCGNTGTYVTCFEAFEKELDGRWVALVAAEDDCHLKLTSPPASKPLTDEEIDDLAEYHGLDSMVYHPFARAIEAAHGITGEQQ